MSTISSDHDINEDDTSSSEDEDIIKKENDDKCSHNPSLIDVSGKDLLNIQLSLIQNESNFNTSSLSWQCSLQINHHNAVLSLEAIQTIKAISLAFHQSQNSYINIYYNKHIHNNLISFIIR